MIREDGDTMTTEVHVGGGVLALCVRIFQNVVLFFPDNLILGGALPNGAPIWGGIWQWGKKHLNIGGSRVGIVYY